MGAEGVDDHELWERIRARDSNAFEAFYRDNAGRLCAFVRQIVANTQAAEDVMQETFTEIWKSPNGFRPEPRSLGRSTFGFYINQTGGQPLSQTPQVATIGCSRATNLAHFGLEIASKTGGDHRYCYCARERRLALTSAVRSAAIFAAIFLSSSPEGSRDISKRSEGA